MGWEGAGAFKSLFKSFTKLRKALKFGDEPKCLGKVRMSLEGNRLHWIHSLIFMSSNSIVITLSLQTPKWFFLLLLCKPTEVPELLCKIPRARRKRLVAQECPRYASQKSLITPERESPFANSSAGWRQLLDTIPRTTPWKGQLSPPSTDSGKVNHVNAMCRQIIHCKICSMETLHVCY